MPVNDELSIIIRARDQASRTINQVQTKMKGLGKGMSAMKGPGLALGGAIAGSVFQFAKAGDEIQKMAIKTGFSTEALSEWKFAAEQSGTSLTQMAPAIRRMQRVVRSERPPRLNIQPPF